MPDDRCPPDGPHGPRVRRNDWGRLSPPDLGAWTPSLAVSVVIPAWDASRTLPTVLAALSAQTYPAHLLEVVVANDGPGALELPELRPERTRVVDVGSVSGGWGPAEARHAGALAAEGDVLHWLDADMLAEAEEIEAQARWHHLLDHAVVLGEKWFVDPEPALAATPEQVRDRVAAGTVGELFAARELHDWVEEIYGRTDDLRLAGWFALRTHAGATASVRRELYVESGGFDVSLRQGEDIALGAALGRVGAVFVPDRQAVSWHLGPSQVMARREQVNAANDPAHADRTPVLRPKRVRGRTYSVPYLEVVLDVAATGVDDLDETTAVVDSVLASSLTDLTVTLVGPWSSLDDARIPVLDDPLLPLRGLAVGYRGEGRVRLAESVTPLSDAAFRLSVPGTTWAPRRRTLERLLLHLEHTHDGLRLLEMKDGSLARLERTAALARARRVARPGEPLDAVLAEIAGVETLHPPQSGFGRSLDLRPSHLPRTGGPPVSSSEAWERVDRQAPRGSSSGA